jgi:hypothetical protein
MTSVAIWPEGANVWAVADTRISASSGGIHTDSGAKILPIAISCFFPGVSGFFDKQAYRSTLGFAYAGSTLSALMTYSATSACLHSLCTPDTSARLNLRDAAYLVERLAQHYLIEIGSLFEVAFFGFCPTEQRLMVFSIRPTIEHGRYVMRVSESDITAPGCVTLLGDKKDEVSARIAAMRGVIGSDGRSGRDPKRALEEIVAERAFQSIGGSMQIGIATIAGFSLYHAVQAVERGKPEAFRSYLGMDLDRDIGNVGDWLINLPGMV